MAGVCDSSVDSGPPATARCPVCNLEVLMANINEHLDSFCCKSSTTAEISAERDSVRTNNTPEKKSTASFFFKPVATVGSTPPNTGKKRALDTTPARAKKSHSIIEGINVQPVQNKSIKASGPATSRKARSSLQPLADLVRPHTLDDYVGQEKIIGPGSILRSLVESDRIPSLVFWGGPGCGKTTLAKIISKQSKCHFAEISAVNAGVSDVRKIIQEANGRKALTGQGTIVFVDEIHRFNKSQQDALLPHVERGEIVLFGATTENPSFSVNAALLSRCRVFVLEKLTPEEITKILHRALTFWKGDVDIEEGALHYLSSLCDGDARNALNALDAVLSATQGQSGEGGEKRRVTCEAVSEAMQKTHLLYDKTGEEHYNIISAFHKSMRGSDADAALYWLARMLEAGEDPRYIARRMIRFASEDVGLADPMALSQAVNAYQASQLIGMPECSVCLAQCAVYLARAPKSNAVYVAYNSAKACIQEHPAYPVPLHIRNAPTQLMKNLGYNKGYKYNPDFKEEDCADQTYLPEPLLGTKFMP